MFVELRINTLKKDRDSFNIGRVQVSGYSLCRCEGTLSLGSNGRQSRLLKTA